MPYDWSQDTLVRGVPMDGAEHALPIRISTRDDGSAIFLAARVPGVMQAIRDMSTLDTAPSADMRALLRTLREVREVFAAVEERVLTTWHERETDPAGWGELGEALEVHRSTAKERYGRIKAANARGLTAEAAGPFGE